ncbi:hypothetical protein VitviT2T_025923 [Vitis vinifera]|uniref:Uncharacterized protein n=1 Tax=Vitis vinifera TaxID=29760 RepID=A0ABY9DKV8_VITVI|nr:hypothetical protein VitviT2T_025923 [Vitis vinifera]
MFCFTRNGSAHKLSISHNFEHLNKTSLSDTVKVVCSEGRIPEDFPEGFYIKNSPNPLFGGLKLTFSIFRRSSHIWAELEGEGMLHAIYFMKDDHGDWTVSYKTNMLSQRPSS